MSLRRLAKPGRMWYTDSGSRVPPLPPVRIRNAQAAFLMPKGIAPFLDGRSCESETAVPTASVGTSCKPMSNPDFPFFHDGQWGKCRKQESNPQPIAYKAIALPLSHSGKCVGAAGHCSSGATGVTRLSPGEGGFTPWISRAATYDCAQGKRRRWVTESNRRLHRGRQCRSAVERSHHVALL